MMDGVRRAKCFKEKAKKVFSMGFDMSECCMRGKGWGRHEVRLVILKTCSKMGSLGREFRKK